MRKTVLTFSLALAAVAFVGSGAQAQGKGKAKGGEHGNGKGQSAAVTHGKGDAHANVAQPQRPGTGRGTGYGVGGTPPGLAKKPGGMPPGQYKKYTPDQGVSIIRDILGRHGYRIVRTSSRGDVRYLYYRTSGGLIRRAVVQPGSDRLAISNVPSSIMREVWARMQ